MLFLHYFTQKSYGEYHLRKQPLQDVGSIVSHGDLETNKRQPIQLQASVSPVTTVVDYSIHTAEVGAYFPKAQT